MDYFTADLHLGHRNILKYNRRFDLMPRAAAAELQALIASGDAAALKAWKPTPETLDHHDDELIRRINDRVERTDTLWILGDFATGKGEDPARLKRYRSTIRCKDLRLIWGNHDHRERLRPLFTHCYEAVMLYIREDATYTEDELWETADRRAWRLSPSWRAATTRVFLSHYCHVVWHQSHKGVYHLYGHSHNNLESWREQTLPSALAMDVGVDASPNYAPRSFIEIHQILGAKRQLVPPHIVDHHTPETPD